MRAYLGWYLVLELAAMVALVYWLGVPLTVLVLLAGSVLGFWLVRREGVRAAWAVAEAVRAGRPAHAELTDGALVGLAGLLIAVPGVLGDLLGLLLVVPPTRALARRRLLAAADRHGVYPGPRAGAGVHDSHLVVDGSVVPPGTARPEPPPASAPRVLEPRVLEPRMLEPRMLEPPSEPRA